jgi:hypothetical protein
MVRLDQIHSLFIAFLFKKKVKIIKVSYTLKAKKSPLVFTENTCICEWPNFGLNLQLALNISYT